MGDLSCEGPRDSAALSRRACDVCGADALFHVTHRGLSQRLCHDCLRRLIPEFDMGSFLEAACPAPTSSSCPNCHTTREELMATGLLGCALCYAVFTPPVAG